MQMMAGGGAPHQQPQPSAPHSLSSSALDHQEVYRGMHFQQHPYQEAKLVRCTHGAIYDVIIDLRPTSETFGKWIGVELTAEASRLLYVPEGFAHGFETLEDATEVTYQVSEFYTPGSEGGLRYDDPMFAIDWPLPVAVISDKDASWPEFERTLVS